MNDIKILGMTWLRGTNDQQYMNYLIKQVRQHPEANSELLHNVQAVYAYMNDAPLFCHRTTSTGGAWGYYDPEPIGAYLISKLGVEGAIKKMSTELITGCPKSHRTWCD